MRNPALGSLGLLVLAGLLLVTGGVSMRRGPLTVICADGVMTGFGWETEVLWGGKGEWRHEVRTSAGAPAAWFTTHRTVGWTAEPDADCRRAELVRVGDLALLGVTAAALFLASGETHAAVRFRRWFWIVAAATFTLFALLDGPVVPLLLAAAASGIALAEAQRTHGEERSSPVGREG